jgi:hypothetical protein
LEHRWNKTLSLWDDFQHLPGVEAIESTGVLERAMGIDPTPNAAKSLIPLINYSGLAANSVQFQFQRYFFDSFPVRISHNMPINFKSCTRIGVTELPLHNFGRSPGVESRARPGSSRGDTQRLCWRMAVSRFELQTGILVGSVSTALGIL